MSSKAQTKNQRPSSRQGSKPSSQPAPGPTSSDTNNISMPQAEDTDKIENHKKRVERLRGKIVGTCDAASRCTKCQIYRKQAEIALTLEELKIIEDKAVSHVCIHVSSGLDTTDTDDTAPIPKIVTTQDRAKRTREEYGKSLRRPTNTSGSSREVSPTRPRSRQTSRPSSRQSVGSIGSRPGSRIDDTLTDSINREQSGNSMETEETDASPFMKPVKTVPYSKLLNKRPVETATRNRFSPIALGHEDVAQHSPCESSADEESGSEEDESRTPEQVRKKARQTAKPVRKERPPPLVLEGSARDNTKEFVTVLKQRIGKFELKHTKNSTIIYLEKKIDYEILKEHLTKEHAKGEVDFHTYTASDVKTHAFVMRGFDGNYEEDEVKTALQEEHNMQIKNVYRMKKTSRPLYLVITDASWTLRKLNTIVRSILHSRISWENRKSSRPISQCYKCLQWGHSETNCFRTQRCAHCTDYHRVTQCPHSEEEPKCNNCKGAHRASSIECPVYLFRVNKRSKEKEATERRTRYVPAPMPTTNRWTTRTEDFPPLPSQRQPTNAHIQTNEQQTTTQQPQSDTTDLNDINELFTEIKKLNSLVNVKGMLLAVKKLNSMLTQTDGTPEAKFLTFNKFVANELRHFDI